MTPRPYALLAELTHRCPLHCPYCSNPVKHSQRDELSTSEWSDALAQAAAVGVVQVGFSGGEPLLRRDLAEIVASARAAGLYSNLITSGVGLGAERARSLRDAGLDSVQLSFQADDPALADAIAGTRAHAQKLNAAAAIRDAGLPLTANVVLHRHNIDRLAGIIDFIAALGARRVELANTQYYGWAWLNRAQLMPTREQVERAAAIAAAPRDGLEIIYVPPDYYDDRPKPCLHGWGQSHLTIAPGGEVLPCPTAWSIPGLEFENVRARPLAEIWRDGASFNAFRGTAWMPEPCRSCPEHDRDFGGCRCQAALIAGDAAATDPVCGKSPLRAEVDRVLALVNESEPSLAACAPRT
ncbi:MAG: pyrroloquinoline quinone biosynthesis protein PqqE [Chthoniobacteraceae bacterium]